MFKYNFYHTPLNPKYLEIRQDFLDQLYNILSYNKQELCKKDFDECGNNLNSFIYRHLKPCRQEIVMREIKVVYRLLRFCGKCYANNRQEQDMLDMNIPEPIRQYFTSEKEGENYWGEHYFIRELKPNAPKVIKTNDKIIVKCKVNYYDINEIKKFYDFLVEKNKIEIKTKIHNLNKEIQEREQKLEILQALV